MTPAQVAHIMSLVDDYVDEQVDGHIGEAQRNAIEAALRDAPQAEGWVMAGWLREWEGDDSDIGAWCFVADESEKDESPNWQPVYWRVAPSAPTAVEPDERATCEWTLEDDDNGTWQSSCGELWSFIEGGPKENRVSFCHNCGKPAIVRASKGTP